MSEEENINVEAVVEPSEAETVPEATEQPQKGTKEYNFAEARRIMQEQNRRIQELEERERYRSYAQQQAQPQPEDELENVRPDEYLTRKQAEALALRKAQELLAEQERANAEDKARLRFRDYDEVVTDENVQELINEDRELGELIANSPHPHATAYKLIRKSAFYQDKGKKKSQEAEKIVKNAQKPVSSNAVPNRPLAAANQYAFADESERRALWKEMQEYASRRN